MSSGAAYTGGAPFTHVRELALTSAVGLSAIFIVDLVDMFFISLLGQPALAAAVGFAGLGLFLGASICIGISVAVSTMVSQAIGEQEYRQVINTPTTALAPTHNVWPHTEYSIRCAGLFRQPY